MQTVLPQLQLQPIGHHLCNRPPTRLAHGCWSNGKTAARKRVVIRAVAGEETEETQKERPLSPLERGGTLTGGKAAGKDAGATALAKSKEKNTEGTRLAIVEGIFTDDRWVDGRWDLDQFKGGNGKVDWDLVIDAEISRRKMLEDSPVASINDAVKFDTSEIPWWAWVKRFHLPVAEKVNGRAAMIGYAMALLVDKLSGASLLDQQGSFLGLLLLHITVFGVLFIQETGDVDKYRNLIDEAFFYDRQWSATWEGQERPSETQE